MVWFCFPICKPCYKPAQPLHPSNLTTPNTYKEKRRIYTSPPERKNLKYITLSNAGNSELKRNITKEKQKTGTPLHFFFSFCFFHLDGDLLACLGLRLSGLLLLRPVKSIFMANRICAAHRSHT